MAQKKWIFAMADLCDGGPQSSWTRAGSSWSWTMDPGPRGPGTYWTRCLVTMNRRMYRHCAHWNTTILSWKVFIVFQSFTLPARSFLQIRHFRISNEHQ